jgi:ADP-heptose:LPS heptosyltransferase
LHLADLLVSVDSSPVHLAGAMGRPVWVLLPFVPDWRWLLGRDDSPWYPGMRLFRQEAHAHWQPVVERMAQALEHFVMEWRDGAI